MGKLRNGRFTSLITHASLALFAWGQFYPPALMAAEAAQKIKKPEPAVLLTPSQAVEDALQSMMLRAATAQEKKTAAVTPEAALKGKLSLQARKDLLKQARAQVKLEDEASSKGFEQVSAHIASHKLPASVQARQQAAQAHHRKEMSAVLASFDAANGAKSEADFNRHAQQAITRLQDQPAFDLKSAARTPFVVPSAKARAPRLEKKQFQSLNATQNMVADGGSSWLPLAAAALGLPAAGDIAATEDVQITPAIQTKAAELHNNPVAIHNWVRNNFTLTPSHGSIQGSAITFDARRGNAHDLASVLIALLRAANIPARYAHGTIKLPVDQAMNWLGGLQLPAQAQQLLSQGGIANQSITAAGQTTHLQFEHVWVEAWVDFYPSRGAVNVTGDSWVAMDASFKQHAYSAGYDLINAVATDSYGLVRQLESSASIDNSLGRISGVALAPIQSALQGYGEQLNQYISGRNPNATVGEVLGTRTITGIDFPGLPASLPYEVVVSDGSAALPDSLRHQLRLGLYASAADRAAQQPVLSYSRGLPSLLGKKLSLSFAPATSDDQAALNSYFPQAHADGSPILPEEFPDSVPGYLIHVKAELRLDGELIASGGDFPLGTQLLLGSALYNPADAQWNETGDEVLTAGEFHSYAVDGAGISAGQVSVLRDRIAATRAKFAAGQHNLATRDEASGDLLYQAALGYFAVADSYARHYQRAAGVVSARLPSIARAVAVLNTQYDFGVPSAVSFPGVELRVDHLAASAAATGSDATAAGKTAAGYQKQTLERGSAYAHLLLENLYSASAQGAPAASAVRALSTALAANQPLYALTSANVNAALPAINLPETAKQDIRDATHAGRTAVVSGNAVTLGSWIGSGYILADEVTGAGAYLLTGGSTAALHSAAGMPWLALAEPLQSAAAATTVAEAAQNLDDAQEILLGDVDGLNWNDLIAGSELTAGLFVGLLGGVDASLPLGWAVDVQSTEVSTSDASSLSTANRSPVFTTSPLTTAVAGVAYVYSASAADPDGDPISYGLGQSPGGMSVSATGLVTWPQPVEGNWPISLRVTDGKSVTQQNYTLKVSAEPAALQLSLSITPAVADPGQAVTITVATAGGAGSISRQLTVDGAPVTLAADGSASVTAPTNPGVYTVVATATDQYGTQTRSSQLSVRDGADSTPPVAQILSPASDTEITAPISITGSATDNNVLAYYQLLLRPAGSADWKEIAKGTTAVSNGMLGQLNPTTLANGLYELNLVATDAGGRTASHLISLEVTRDLKLGQFSISFEDLNVEAAGMPLRVTRTYDTRIKDQKKDFGYGWTVDYQSLAVRQNVAMGLNWQQYNPGGFQLCVRPGGAHKISITLPDGHVERFSATQQQECGTGQLPPVNIVFTPLPGTLSKLEALDMPANLRFQGGQILDIDNFGYWEPTRFKLTTEDQTQYTVRVGHGIESVRDPFGNTLTYTTNGIVHSDGRSIPFTRDSQGRITKITDPAGKTILYGYNAAGDLVSVTDREGKVTTLAYNNTHGLTDYTDPRGIKVAKQIYDEQGRLIASIDANGQRTDVTHDTDSNTEIVKDRRGYETKYVYDAAGNVTSMTNALNQTTHYTYDALGNETSVLDPLGNLTTRIFDPQKGKLLSESVTVTPGVVLTTSYTYDANGNPKTTTDPKGKVTTYNTSLTTGRPLSIAEPLGRTSSFGYDGAGNLNALNLAGDSTGYTYDAKGNRTSETDASGHTTTYTFDTNGRETKKTWTQTVDGVLKTFSESTVYDTEGRVTEVTDAQGFKSKTSYNVAGKPVTETDALGRVTTFVYNERLQLIETAYPDGTKELTGYDAEGNEVSKTDRQGRVTRTEYDALNRPIKTIAPDGSFTGTTYDAAGRVKTTTDARDNVTTNDYDGAGRLTSVTNALQQVIRYGYDANGNRTSVTDPSNEVTTFEYDDLNRLVKTIYPDLTFSAISWTPRGRKESETDQNGTTTHFGYDGTGRLTSVTQSLNGTDLVTSYGYDEAGNKTRQTDAQNRVTTWSYDSLGRVTGRKLPLNQSESFQYDANGNLKQHTDFNGAATRYAYDSSDRQAAKLLPGGGQVNTTYTANGQVATQTDYRGVIRYSYDSLERLTKKDSPEGIISYAYDRNGNKTQVTTASGAVKYQYDELNRLASVTDQGNKQTTYEYDLNGNRKRVSLPNNTSTVYEYDSLNRLKKLTHQKTDSGEVLAQYRYALKPNGMREKLEEYNSESSASGNSPDRVVSYTYDGLYRLTEEKVEKRNATSGQLEVTRTTSYVYDNTGNRLSKTETVGAVTTTTAYAYDGNDRLNTETATGGAEAGVTTYTYDDNGNTRTKAVVPAQAGTQLVTIYGYDSDNRLTSLKQGATEASAALVVSYEYDADGNRTKSSAGGSVTSFLVDTNQEYAQVLEEVATGPATSRVSYVYGDDLLSQMRAGQQSFYHYDGLGSTRALSNITGAVTDRYDFEAFGNIESHAGNTPNSYLYAGEQLDPNLGFYYLRARYMDPRVGRFASQDIFQGELFQPKSLHKYAYASSDPAYRVDPGGLQDLISFSTALTAGGILYSSYSATTDIINGQYGSALLTIAFGALVGALTLTKLAITAAPAIGATGKIGEKALKTLGGTSQKYFPTSIGKRYIDQLVSGMANESKVGYTTLTATIRKQIQKDIELITTGEIRGSTWHFFKSPATGQGASQPLLDELFKSGIAIVYALPP